MFWVFAVVVRPAACADAGAPAPPAGAVRRVIGALISERPIRQYLGLAR
jgi:hypothetical protein